MPKLKTSDDRICATALQYALDTLEIAGPWDWDIGSDVVRSNTFVALLFGVDPDEAAAGLPLSAYIRGMHRDDQEHVHTLIRRSVDEDVPFVAEYRVHSADGVTRWVLDRGYIMRDSLGRPARGRGIIVDLTRSRTGKFTATVDDPAPVVSPLEQAADHAVAAQRIIAELQDPDLKARADALLFEVGRRLAQHEVRARRRYMN